MTHGFFCKGYGFREMDISGSVLVHVQKYEQGEKFSMHDKSHDTLSLKVTGVKLGLIAPPLCS